MIPATSLPSAVGEDAASAAGILRNEEFCQVWYAAMMSSIGLSAPLARSESYLTSASETQERAAA